MFSLLLLKKALSKYTLDMPFLNRNVRVLGSNFSANISNKTKYKSSLLAAQQTSGNNSESK